jgi:hypothetical protein
LGLSNKKKKFALKPKGLAPRSQMQIAQARIIWAVETLGAPLKKQ